MVPSPPKGELSDAERQALEAVVRCQTTAQPVAQRARLVLASADGLNQAQIAPRLGVSVETARLWRRRWFAVQPATWADRPVQERLSDLPRPGRPSHRSTEPVCPITALAGAAPATSGRPITHWTGRASADEVQRPGIVARLSPRGAAAQQGDRRPHLMRDWLTPPTDAPCDTQVADIGAVSRDAPQLAEQHERVVSPDELTGAQAVERLHPGLPLAPGQVERREVESVRHGPSAFLLSRDVLTGQVVAPTWGPPRTEADFLAHVQGVVATDPAATRWHFVVDHLDLHRSASLVRWVAAASELPDELGVKGHSGIWPTCQTRATFLSDPPHRIGFHSTPKHGSWLNPIAIWLSILVRQLLHPGAFTSVDDLSAKVLAFIAYYNRTMTRPFRWTYQGKPLVA